MSGTAHESIGQLAKTKSEWIPKPVKPATFLRSGGGKQTRMFGHGPQAHREGVVLNLHVQAPVPRSRCSGLRSARASGEDRSETSQKRAKQLIGIR